MLQEIIARLEETMKPPLLEVEGAAEFAALRTPPTRVPRAYVLPATDSAGPNQRINRTAQSVATEVDIVLLHLSRRDGRGEAAAIDLEGLYGRLRRSLVDWSPGEGFERFSFTGGRLIRVDDGVLAWRDRFQTRWTLFGGTP